MSPQLKALWQFMEGHRRRYAAAVGVMIIGTLFGFAVPIIAKFAIDGAIERRRVEAPQALLKQVERLGGWEWVAQNLWIAGGLMVTCTAFAGLGGYLRGRWAAEATESICARLRNRLYDHLQRMPMAYHHEANAGDLIQRCTSDVDTIRVFLTTEVVEVGRAFAMLILVTPIMLWLDWRMTLVALSLIPVVILFATLFYGRVKAAFKLTDEAEGAMTNVLQENLNGIRVVRAFARQEYEAGKFAERNANHRDRGVQLVNLMAVYWSVSEVLCVSQNGINLIGGAWFVSRGMLSIGALFAFLALVGMMLWPVRQMGRILTDLGKAMVAIGRIQEILDQPLEGVADGAQAAARPERLRGEIAMQAVGFGYKPGTDVLRGLDLHVRPGETLAIVGPTGSGKSTIAKMLLRIHEGYTGSIRLDGLELRELERGYVRSQVGIVLQQPFLFSRTLRENIVQGRLGDAATPAEIEAVASASCVHETILKFEHGYDTEVGERGVTLSGGQRQRVALARALLRRPPILILDDALSAVDTHTETMILNELEKRRGHQTTLIITHRLSSLRLADRIVVLEHGRVTQCGPHEQLMAEDGLYRRLWDIQGSLEEDLREDLQPA